MPACRVIAWLGRTDRKSEKNKLLFLFQSCLEIWAASSDIAVFIMSTSGQADPEMQSE
jgi:hypothetical protein